MAYQVVSSLINSLRSGALSLQDYLAEIESAYKEREPTVNAFLSEARRFSRLRREATVIERDNPQPINRPPLYGIPIGVKDIFRVDGFETHAGSKLPAEVLKGRESRVVTLLKQAGCLIMGKTQTTEFAYFGAGPTRNPHAPEHTPGGSSSGSAAAVAAGLCPIALGTQTIGSIIRPAAYCGVVGYKPSYDRISKAGVIPLAPSLDHVGFFAYEVPAVELVASLLCPDWHLTVNDSLPVLGIPTGPYLEQVTAEGRENFVESIDRLNKAGCIVKEVPAMPDFSDIVVRHGLIIAAEAAQVHATWYSEFGDPYHTKTADLIREGRIVSVGELAEALTGRQQLRRQLTGLMDDRSIDLWVSPAATGFAPKGLENTGDPVMNLPWTHSGLPTVTIPSGKNAAGLPLGLQITGRWYEDERLLDWSIELETILTK
jgi:Asp-tRNA(Asn)/Glu-tRNA(Gln) amidotransferase A subunit family amidase